MENTITEVIDALDNYSAVETGTPHIEAVLKVDDNNLVKDIPPRENLYRGQTPQGFRLPIIRDAHEQARNEGYKDAHCDCELVLKYESSEVVYMVRGSEYNIKITYPFDILIAEIFLKALSDIPPNNKSG